jgi:hypothetical protein
MDSNITGESSSIESPTHRVTIDEEPSVKKVTEEDIDKMKGSTQMSLLKPKQN